MFTFYYKCLIFIEIIYNLGNKIGLYLICNGIYGFVGKAEEPLSVNTDSQWSKQEVCFARENQVWLTVNHNTSVTSGE